HTHGGRKERARCTHRANLVCLDIDSHALAMTAKKRLQDGFPFNFALWETSSSTPDAQRVRVIVDAEDIPQSDYKRAVLFAFGRLGISAQDLSAANDKAFGINQPMILPFRFADDEETPKVLKQADARPLKLEDMEGFEPEPNSQDSFADADFKPGCLDIDTIEKARQKLHRVSPDRSRNDWVKVAAALKHQFPNQHDEAFELFNGWSAKGGKYQGEEDCRKAFDSVKEYRNGSNADFSSIIWMGNEDEKQRRKAPWVHVDQVSFCPKVRSFVKGLFLFGTLSMVYAARSAGKSFFMLDLAASVACGRQWRDRKVKQGAVLYLCLEGQRGFQDRILAFRKEGLIPNGCPIWVREVAFNLSEKEDVGLLLTELAEAPEPIAWVIVDTLSQSMPGKDENSFEAISEVLANAQAVKEQSRAAVTVVHHTGKDASRGARGHSDIEGKVDTLIELTRKDQLRTATVRKQKDCPGEGDRFPFKLKSVMLGIDDDDEPVTSCVVKHLDESEVPSTETRGAPKGCGPEVVAWFIPEDGIRKTQLVSAMVAEVRHPTGKKQGQPISERKAEELIKGALVQGLIRQPEERGPYFPAMGAEEGIFGA
ncbi:MAG: AAA family ATPase, partial [Opitutales bacterium]